VKTRIIAIDGPGGSGKSSLAGWLAPKLDAKVIHTDDFAAWDDPVDWWPRLLMLALEPLAAGRAARYEPTGWGGQERQPIAIEPSGTVIIEGVTASRAAARPSAHRWSSQSAKSSGAGRMTGGSATVTTSWTMGASAGTPASPRMKSM